MSNVVQFKRKETSTHAPIPCRYEFDLLKLCDVLITNKSKDRVEDIAACLYTLQEKKLKTYLQVILQDNLILECIATHAQSLCSLDRLFLINVLESKFPEDTSAIQMLKLLIFGQDTLKMNSKPLRTDV